MKLVLIFCFFILSSFYSSAQPADFVWTSPSKNASESMPCGGGDIGMNVWAEGGDILFYLSRSGSFDENNTLLKQGRFRISISPSLDLKHFRQTLHLNDGCVSFTDGDIDIRLWVDVQKPVVHINTHSSKQKLSMAVTYENWRTRDITMTKREAFQSSYKFAAPKGLVTHHDSIIAHDHAITFLHHNQDQTIFDATVEQQQMTAVKDRLYNPLRQLTFGGRMKGDGFVFVDKVEGTYAHTPYEGWMYVTEQPRKKSHIQITLANQQGSIDQWLATLNATEQQVRYQKDRQTTLQWWHQFWQRSYVEGPDSMLRNYTLFRYMLGCNARGQWPTKFNGGLFTFDPEYVNPAPEYLLSPDFRNWGGGVHTAQNQRLVYWPMLKSGDYDLLMPQLDFYLNIYKNAEERSRLYWGHEGACLTEQIENYGLP